MKRNQAIISELIATGLGIAVCVFGPVLPLVLGFVVAIARMVFFRPNMWSGFRVSFTLSAASFVVFGAPEMPFVIMAYGLAGALLGQSVKQLILPPSRVRSKFPRLSYETVVLILTGLCSVAQTVHYSFYGRMLHVSVGRLQEYVIIEAMGKVRELYQSAGLAQSLLPDDTLFTQMASMVRLYMPTQIILTGLLFAIVSVFIFILVIPVSTPLRAMLKKWQVLNMPLSWVISFAVAFVALGKVKVYPQIASILLNFIVVMACVFIVSGFSVARQWLLKWIPHPGLATLMLVMFLGFVAVFMGFSIFLSSFISVVLIDNYSVYRNSKKLS